MKYLPTYSTHGVFVCNTHGKLHIVHMELSNSTLQTFAVCTYGPMRIQKVTKKLDIFCVSLKIYRHQAPTMFLVVKELEKLLIIKRIGRTCIFHTAKIS